MKIGAEDKKKLGIMAALLTVAAIALLCSVRSVGPRGPEAGKAPRLDPAAKRSPAPAGEGDDFFIAREGDIVKNRYKIVRINRTSVMVEDLLTSNRQPIPMTGAKGTV